MSRQFLRQPEDMISPPFDDFDASSQYEDMDFASAYLESYPEQMIDFSAFDSKQETAFQTSLASEPAGQLQITSHGQIEQPGQTDSHLEPSSYVIGGSSTTIQEHPKRSCAKRGLVLDWEAYRPAIKSFYLDQNLTLNATMQRMKERGLKASKRKLKDKLKEWKMEKNISSAVAKFMYYKQQLRQELFGKSTVFRFRGREVPEAKYVRPEWMEKDDDAQVPAETPSCLSCVTPQSLAGSVGEQHNSTGTTRPIELGWNGLDAFKTGDLMESWIRDTEHLGGHYYPELMDTKYEAGCAYLRFLKPTGVSDSISTLISLLRTGEQYLNEYISWASLEHSDKIQGRVLFSLKTLMVFHIEEEKLEKLAARCATIYPMINNSDGLVGISRQEIFEAKVVYCLSMMALSRFDEASVALLHLQTDIDNQPEYESQKQESLDNTIRRMVCFLKLGYWHLAKPLVLEAQSKAKVLLPAEDSMHTRLKRCLKSREWHSGSAASWVTQPHESGHVVARCRL